MKQWALPSIVKSLSFVIAFFVASIVPIAVSAETINVGSNYNNSNAGLMFDVTATNAVTLNSLTFSNILLGGTFNVYGRNSTHVGNDASSSGWTLLASGTLASGSNIVFPTTFNFTIPAGSTYALYISSADGGRLNYQNGSSTVGAVEASDANVQIRAGGSVSAPFGGVCCSPRRFSGLISYNLATPVPTLSQWAMILLGLILAGGAAVMIHHRRGPDPLM